MRSPRADRTEGDSASDKRRHITTVIRAVTQLAVAVVAPAVRGSICSDGAGVVAAGNYGLQLNRDYRNAYGVAHTLTGRDHVNEAFRSSADHSCRIHGRDRWVVGRPRDLPPQ